MYFALDFFLSSYHTLDVRLLTSKQFGGCLEVGFSGDLGLSQHLALLDYLVPLLGQGLDAG